MNNAPDPSPVTLTAPGFFHGRLPVSPSPLAMEPAVENGVPVIEVTLGLTAGGKPVTIKVSSLDYLDALEYHVRASRARLVMWTQDHDAHPFDPDLWGVVEATKPLPGTAAAA